MSVPPPHEIKLLPSADAVRDRLQRLYAEARALRALLRLLEKMEAEERELAARQPQMSMVGR